MAINFPVLLDDLANVATGNTITPAHKNDLNDIVEALEAKVGINSSAVTTSHDYLLTHLPAQAQNLDIGAYNLRGLTLTSDVVTGTIPIIITSTTMCTNLNANYVGGTALAGLQTVLTNSAGLLAALSDETGTGLAVFNNTPTLVAPVLGAATATTINKVTITAPAASATLTIANTKTLTVTGDATISATPYTPGGTDVALADGGTGAGTQAGAANAVLPSQTGNANKCLATDASNVSWQVLGTAGGGTGATAAANAASGVVVLNASSQLPAVSAALLTNVPAPADASISQAKLKTATGEVSSTVTGDSAASFTLPGGTYGFYPQIKGYILQGVYANTVTGFVLGGSSAPNNANYTTLIQLHSQDGSTVYAQQRYVTASGEDMWIFLLIDKTTKEIISAYQAPDHPAYGNGGDFDKLPHPFGNYDGAKHEIVLVDNDTIVELKTQVTEEKSLLTLVNELYKPDMDKEEVYKPLHSGRFLGKQPELVQTIPAYIKVRKLEKLTQADKDAKKNIHQQRTKEAQEKKRIEDLIEAKKRELAIAELKKEGKL